MIRPVLAGGILTVVAMLAVTAGRPSRGTRLWPGSRFSRQDRDQAVRRGMKFLYESIARNPRHFADWGHDLLSAFYNIAETSSDPALSDMAWRMGRERAREWRRMHPVVPAGAGVNEVMMLVFGHDAAGRLGVPDPQMQAALTQAAARYTSYDFLWFDPLREPPPSDVPAGCRCGRQNDRGMTVCTRCGAKLTMQNRYDVFQDALIATYTGDRAGIQLGAHYPDVLRWLPEFRPYPPPTRDNSAGIYTITHVIYTYNDYSQNLVSRDCFPEEFDTLRRYLRQAETDRDAEIMGEYLDTLRAFGLTTKDHLIQAGFEYLLGAQNPDGSWGDPKDPNVYGRYHPTWTAIDGLRDYRWTKVLPCPSPCGAGTRCLRHRDASRRQANPGKIAP